MSGSVTITLRSDVALVLFEWLSLREEQRAAKQPWSAEDVALSNVLCSLEATLVEPFDKDYIQLVEAARQRLLGGCE